MKTVNLIDMPFAKASMPSIALTQLRSVLEERLGESVQVNLYYFNLDMAVYLGEDIYEFICNSAASNNSGFGDWYFRNVAFPDLPDNTSQYFTRYGPMFGDANLKLYFDELAEKRNHLENFLEELINSYNLLGADLTGFTSMFMQNAPTFAMARLLKSHKPDMTIVMGGANCEYPMGKEIINNVAHIDYVFSGPSLVSFPDFVQRYFEGTQNECNKLNGVFSRNNIDMVQRITDDTPGEDKVIDIIGPERDINKVIFPDYDSFLKDYEEQFSEDALQRLELLMETSRGCWWGAKAHCTFCGLNGATMAYRALNAENAIDMLQEMFEKYGDKAHYFSSVDNIVPKEYISDVFPKLDVPEGISMFYEVKADLSEEDMKVLAESNVLMIQPGIESLATSTLKLMRKGTTAFNNIKFLENALKYGIKPAWNLLIGFPGEVEDVFEKYLNDLPKLFHLPPPVGVGTVRFDRFSPYFTQADAYGLDLKPLDFYQLIFPFDEASLMNFAYYFMDMNYDAEYIKAYSKYVEPLNQLVNEWKAKWNSGVENIPVLYLFEKDGHTCVYDSRSDITMEYEVSELDVEILYNLSLRKSLKAVYSSLKQYSREAIDASVQKLEQNELLFEENGTYMSLILLFKSKKPESKLDKIFY